MCRAGIGAVPLVGRAAVAVVASMALVVMRRRRVRVVARLLPSPSRPKLEIQVIDTGIGIAPEDQANVFESFKQTDTGLRQGAGTGLGMPISKSLAEAHGGRRIGSSRDYAR